MTAGDIPHTATIRRLIGVYNANGTIVGELAYFVGARFGRAHCALCDITHGLARERSDWKACRQNLSVPFASYHLDDQPDAVRAAYNGAAPAVLAETDDDTLELLGPHDLEACAGSIDRFTDALDAAVQRCALVWPTGP